jgi:hypothetical protein
MELFANDSLAIPTCVNGHYVLPMGGRLMCPLVASKTAR